MTRRFVHLLVLSAALGVAPVAGAQGTASPFAPWIGCWDLMPRDNNAPPTSERVCVVPTEQPSAVELVSLAGDSIVARQRVDASSAKHAVQQEGCTGDESVQATGVRVYLRTTMTCGDQKRLVNSVMAMTRDGEWLDVRGVAFGSNVGVRALRYREAPAGIRLPPSVATALRDQPRGMHPARQAASTLVQLSDVVEASRFLEVGVLQTLLAERGQGFGLDAQRLVALESSGVPTPVIDVMVALSYPEVFALDRTALGDAPPDTRGEMRGDGFGGGDYYDGGWGYDPYGYGYGRGYGWAYGGRPVVVVQRPSGDSSDDAEHGKVVKGRGYVSGRNDGSGSGKATGSSGGSSAGRASSSDSEKKGSSTGRKAKPKPSE